MYSLKKIIRKINDYYRIRDELRMISESGYFDAGWYKKEYGKEDLSNDQALRDYYFKGWKEGLSSGVLFDGKSYLEKHDYLQSLNRNALIDYLQSDKEVRDFFLPGAETFKLDFSENHKRCILSCYLRNDNGVYTVPIPVTKRQIPECDYICVTDNRDLLSIGFYNGWKFVEYTGGSHKYEDKIRLVKYNLEYFRKYIYVCWMSPYVGITRFTFHKMVFNPLYRDFDFAVLHEDENCNLADRYDIRSFGLKKASLENVMYVFFDLMFFDLSSWKTRKFLDFNISSCLRKVPELVAFHLFNQKYKPEISYVKKSVFMERVCKNLPVDETRRPMVSVFGRLYFLDREFALKVVEGRLKNHALNLSEKRIERLIVSLTTFAPRINDVPFVIFSILLNTVLPEKIVLCVSEDDFPNREKDFPKILTDLIEESKMVEIIWTENTKSYKKLLPVIRKYPEYTVITVDDDIFYPAGLIKNLYDEHQMYPDSVIASRAHRMRYSDGKFESYENWKRDTGLSFPSHEIMPTGCGGILYPSGCFYGDVDNKSLFSSLAETTDDLWFWAMTALKGYKKKVTRKRLDLVHVDIVTQLGCNEKPSLMKINYVEGNNNNVQLDKIFGHYEALKKLLEGEKSDVEHPLVSVIVPVYNAEDSLRKCVDSLLSQTLKNIEIILVNDGSTDGSSAILNEYAESDSRIKIINQSNQGCNVARNRAIRIARGNYIGFVDADDSVSDDYFSELYETAVSSEADIAATPNAVWINEEGFSLKNFGIPFKDGLFRDRKNIAVRSGTVWNKIYSRDLIIRNNIMFCEQPKVIGGDNKFTFGAMMYCNKVMINCKPKYTYRKNSDSITNKKKTKDDVRIFSLYREISDDIEKSLLSPEDKKSWLKTVVQRLERDLMYYFRGLNEEDRDYFLNVSLKYFPELNIDNVLPG